MLLAEAPYTLLRIGGDDDHHNGEDAHHLNSHWTPWASPGHRSCPRGPRRCPHPRPPPWLQLRRSRLHQGWNHRETSQIGQDSEMWNILSALFQERWWPPPWPSSWPPSWPSSCPQWLSHRWPPSCCSVLQQLTKLGHRRRLMMVGGWLTYIYKIYHGYNLKENYVVEYILMMLTWLILGLILCTPKAGKAGHDTWSRGNYCQQLSTKRSEKVSKYFWLKSIHFSTCAAWLPCAGSSSPVFESSPSYDKIDQKKNTWTYNNYVGQRG